MKKKKNRNLGLDIARSLAIIMVLISHGRAFFPGYNLDFLSVNGYFGVELFFVLSGFLIGQIIINDLFEKKSSISNLKDFYLRRWFRTLPLYFLVVFFLWFIGRPFNIQSIFFIQNFSPKTLEFIPVSWSLVIEEWFYLIVPFFLLLLTRFWRGNKKRFFMLFCLGVILVELVSRIIYVQEYNPTWDYEVRKQVFLRMDSLIIGVLLAGIKIYYKEFYDTLASYTKLIFIFAITGLVLCEIYFIVGLDSGKEAINASFFARTFLFTIVSIFFGLLIVAFEKSNFINVVYVRSKSAKVFKFVSLTSYAVYLIHYDFYHYFQGLGVSEDKSSIYFNFVLLIAALFVTFFTAAVLYKYYEKPIMGLRDRFTPKHRNQDVLVNTPATK